MSTFVTSTGTNQAPPPERLYTVGEVAARLSVNSETVRRWILKGAMLHVRVGPGTGLIRITETELQRHIRHGQ